MPGGANQPASATGAATGTSCGHRGDAEPAPLSGITAVHNAVRCAVERPSGGTVAPLSWSSSLAADAQRYADTLAKTCDLRHAQTEYGENLFAGSGRYGPGDVVGRWAKERGCFHYDEFPASCDCTCGHYTQLVWADTQRLGCGMATCADGTEIWVCRYDPAGNFTDAAPY